MNFESYHRFIPDCVLPRFRGRSGSFDASFPNEDWDRSSTFLSTIVDSFECASMCSQSVCTIDVDFDAGCDMGSLATYNLAYRESSVTSLQVLAKTYRRNDDEHSSINSFTTGENSDVEAVRDEYLSSLDSTQDSSFSVSDSISSVPISNGTAERKEGILLADHEKKYVKVLHISKSDSELLGRSPHRSNSFFAMIEALPSIIKSIISPPSENLTLLKSIKDENIDSLTKAKNFPSSYAAVLSPLSDVSVKFPGRNRKNFTSNIASASLIMATFLLLHQKQLIFVILDYIYDIKSASVMLMTCKHWNSLLVPDKSEMEQSSSIILQNHKFVRPFLYKKIAKLDNPMNEYRSIPMVVFSSYVNVGKDCFDAIQIERDVLRSFGRSANKSKRSIIIGFEKSELLEISQEKLPKNEDTELWNNLTLEVKQCILRNVLLAIVGSGNNNQYCQGQDRIIGHLMRVFSCVPLNLLSRTVFETYICLFDKYRLRQLYDVESGGILICMEIFMKLLSSELPKLYAHMNDIDFSIEMIVFGWFQTLFCSLCLPFSTIARIFDWWIVNGSFEVFFKTGLALLKLNQESLLKQDFNGFAEFLSTFPDEEAVNADRLIQAARSIKFTLHDLICIEKAVRIENRFELSSESSILLQFETNL